MGVGRHSASQGPLRKGRQPLECQCCFCVLASGALGKGTARTMPFPPQGTGQSDSDEPGWSLLRSHRLYSGCPEPPGVSWRRVRLPSRLLCQGESSGSHLGSRAVERESMKHMPFIHALPQDPGAPSSRVFTASPSIGRSEEAATDAVCIIYCILGGFRSHSFNQGRGLLHSVLRKSTDIKAEKQTRRLEKRTR